MSEIPTDKSELSLLTGEESHIHRLAMTEGPLVAKEFVLLFNNGCRQRAMFETLCQDIEDRVKKDGFFAPLNNLSRMKH